MFGPLFGNFRKKNSPELLLAIERAVSRVEPLLKQVSGYPGSYREPVAVALEYARRLAAGVPGPVVVDREAYAKDPFVRALFPDIDLVSDAICSSMALQDYMRNVPSGEELYALMGMRRVEKSVVGMDLSGDEILRDVAQTVVYFTSHTLENPAASEQQARDLIAASFLDSLVDKVKDQIERRKQEKHLLLQKKDTVMARLHAAGASQITLLEIELARLLDDIQSVVNSLELSRYAGYFEEVLLHPEQFLRLEKKAIVLDSMGVRREGDAANRGEAFTFSELIGYDRRDWIVTMVRCRNLRSESFATKLDKAYRKLTI